MTKRLKAAGRHVRFGSLADISQCNGYVRFSPESGHWQRNYRCPLWAKSGHCRQNGTACAMRVRYTALNSS
jgi:hypothetical protein